MARPNATAWVDETGVGDGTPVSALRMENIENAIAALSPVPISIAAGVVYKPGANSQTLFRETITIAAGGSISVPLGSTLVKI